jgi:hypothetical protein
MKKNACSGCGMVDPCGYHFTDCKLLEIGDFVVPVSYRKKRAWVRESVARPATVTDVRFSKRARCAYWARAHGRSITPRSVPLCHCGKPGTLQPDDLIACEEHAR